jgi:hypothetical protein
MLTEPFSQYKFARLVGMLRRWPCEPAAAVTRFRLALLTLMPHPQRQTLAVVGLNYN